MATFYSDTSKHYQRLLVLEEKQKHMFSKGTPYGTRTAPSYPPSWNDVENKYKSTKEPLHYTVQNNKLPEITSKDLFKKNTAKVFIKR